MKDVVDNANDADDADADADDFADADACLTVVPSLVDITDKINQITTTDPHQQKQPQK